MNGIEGYNFIILIKYSIKIPKKIEIKIKIKFEKNKFTHK